MERFIVMTGAARMPLHCKGRYRRVAVVELQPGYIGYPAMIATHARGVARVVKTWERLHVGKTDRCAYARALADAWALADALNAGPSGVVGGK